MAKGGSPVTDFEGVEPAPAPFWATEAITHGTPDICQRYCVIVTPSPVYLIQTRKT